MAAPFTLGFSDVGSDILLSASQLGVVVTGPAFGRDLTQSDYLG